MIRRALFAGSFDPPTLGHLWIARTGCDLFDELIVAVGHNPDKTPLLSQTTRVALFERALAEEARVAGKIKVLGFTGKLTVDLAREVGAGFLLRGIRGHDDLGYETTQRHVNADLAPNLTTVFLMPPREIANISSSFVRGLLQCAGWPQILDRFVPPAVLKHLLQRG